MPYELHPLFPYRGRYVKARQRQTGKPEEEPRMSKDKWDGWVKQKSEDPKVTLLERKWTES